ncbi:MAG: hypothetical protein J5526_07345 [Bacteroidales bacterium]|nr:hypothetical protein [Bacteroidales bacterium]
MIDIALIIIVLAVGLILLTLEIVALPGGIAGSIGLLMLAFGIWWTYKSYGNTAGSLVLVGCIALTVVFLVFLLKSKTWKKFSLKEESDSKVNQIDRKTIQVGAHGKTVARLAPTGKALIDGVLVEVHAINKFIDPDKPIEVIAVEGYRIDVKESDDERF